MASSEETPLDNDDAIACVAETYLQDRKNGTAGTIESYLVRYPHLGNELRDSLEAIDLLLPTSSYHIPQVLGDFRIEKEIGRGGIGIVYSAIQSSLQRKVALKVLNSRHGETAFVEQFRREAQTVACLHHECIVPIYAVGEADGHSYFAMQWIDGESVSHQIAKRKGLEVARKAERLRLREIAGWGGQIADALNYAHQQGVIHRDIKPSNLLIDRNQRIWLTDFGLALNEKHQDASIASEYSGTPNYMSPEQASAIAAPVDHRTDIYSLGVTLMEWITGQSFVGGSNPVESLSRLQQNAVEEPRVLMRGLSRDWVAVLEKCTARQPKDRYSSAASLAADLRAIANGRPVTARTQPALVRTICNLVRQPSIMKTAWIAAVASLMLFWAGHVAWRTYSNSKMIPVIFDSKSGDWLAITAKDATGQPIAKFTTTDGEVMLPRKPIQLDVVASQRLGYTQSIDPTPSNIYESTKSILLDDPQSPRWIMDDMRWFQPRPIIRNGKSANVCFALRGNSIQLMASDTGEIHWKFNDPQNVLWGNQKRGCPSSFQPDRFALIADTNRNGSPEIVLAHPNAPELLCLDCEMGEELWRCNLLESTGIQTPNATSLCPIVVQEFVDEDRISRLSVVIASRNPELADQDRWLMNVHPATGQVQWKVASQFKLTSGAPITSRPLHAQWGQVEAHPKDFGYYDTTDSYFDDYWRSSTVRTATVNHFDARPSFGTERPFTLIQNGSEKWYWIDGPECHVIEPHTGKMVHSWSLLDDCVCPPKFLRTGQGRILVLTAHKASATTTDFVALDIETNAPAWTKTLKCNLDRLPQSYQSPKQVFPMVVDLDRDGSDEWIAPSYIPGNQWSHPMVPPHGSLMAFHGNNAEPVWEEPCNVPNADRMLERSLVGQDQDGDGWKDLLIGSRFMGGGVRDGVSCFVELISGRTGKPIWHTKVRNESSHPARDVIELVDFSVIDEHGLVAVVTHRSMMTNSHAYARPYSTTFLNLSNGREEAFGSGIFAKSFGNDYWLEYRIPPDFLGNSNQLPRGKLVGWAYPVKKRESETNSTLWRTENYSSLEISDVDHDGFPEVVASNYGSERRTVVLLDGLTGSKRWSRATGSQPDSSWSALEQDENGDGTDDLLSYAYDGGYQGNAARKAQHPMIEIVSGATGKTLWQLEDSDSGAVTMPQYLGRRSGKLPILIYQDTQNKRVKCVDLELSRIAWTSNDFQGELIAGEYTPWVHQDRMVWFSVCKTDDGLVASFVDAETGESILRIPIGPKPTKRQDYETVAQPKWIQWQGKELLAVQSLTSSTLNTGSGKHQFETNLWLFDKSVQLVGHWTETTETILSPAMTSWLEGFRYDAPPPTVAKMPDGQELLAITVGINGSFGCRLLGWDEYLTDKLHVDRTISFPNAAIASYAGVLVFDADGDSLTDFVTISDGNLQCMTGSGKMLWRKSDLPTEMHLLSSKVFEGRTCIGLQQGHSQSFLLLDASTGEDRSEAWAELKSRAFNANEANHRSWITSETTNQKIVLSAIRREGAVRPAADALQADPRRQRLLPWVVTAKSILFSVQREVRFFSWPRVLMLAFGAILIPGLVAWSCLRKRFSLRHVIIVVTTVALALTLILVDQREFPTDDKPNGFRHAMNAAWVISIHIFGFALPVIELTQVRWRRNLSIAVYGLMLIGTPLLSLFTNPVGVVRTTYIGNEWWHLVWFALLCAGLVLFLFHSLRILFRVGLFGVNFVRWSVRSRRSAAL